MKKLATLLFAAAALGVTGCGGDDDGAESAGGAAPFDRAFIDAMVPHHQAAIAMAKEAKQAGLSQPELISIADDIIGTQQAEIDQMLAWRDQWFGSAEPEPQEAALETLGLTPAEAGMEHGGVDLASVDDVDQTFAGMMIGHHVGAIRMAELAEEEADHDEVKQLAADIITAQQREIEIMEKHAMGGHG
jgi:predicted outer membrane protein